MHVLALGEGPSPEDVALRLCTLPGLSWLDGQRGHREGRFSFIGVEPVERVVAPLALSEPLAACERLEPAARVPATSSGAVSGAPPAEAVPCWIGYVAYDAHFAGRPQRLIRPGQRPALSFARYDALFAFDHERARAFIVGDDRDACERLRARVAGAHGRMPRARVGVLRTPPVQEHRAAIERALQHIARGDVYQVNLARCFSAAFEGAPLALWSCLRHASPVPLGFYHDDGARVLLARTMERFVRWQRSTHRLWTRPIKGTIARSGACDQAEAARLRADDKERAEHAMIVDLMRNDLGRVAQTGSVRVPEVMAVEPYAGLFHLVSTVECLTRSRTGLRDVLQATFPPGSVTGTPKLRAIEIIESLEPEPRDAYTGAVGFVDRAGGLSLAVAIRSAIVEGGGLRYYAGGGIVEASRPERELEETELKARVLRDALAQLERLPGDDSALSTGAILR